MYQYYARQQGFSLVEAIIVSALSVLVFVALFAAFQHSLKLSTYSRIKLSALSVANERMEYFRSLPYTDVGTVSGIPSGTIPQNSVISLNGINFQERVLVEYVDDEADGLGALDSNGIVSDYKRLKLEYTWTIGADTNRIELVSNIVPRSVETTAGGGTVRINVLNSDSTLLPGASVRLINNTVGPIDVTKFTDASGAALFSGAPAGSDYEVVVTASIGGHDYSTAQTYQATLANPNPIVSPFAVLEADVSTLTFQIGELSDLNIYTRSAISEGSSVEEFTNLLAVDSSTAVEAVGGKLVLQNTVGVYETNGTAYLGPIAPAPLLEWQTLRVAATLPTNTSHQVQFFTGVVGGPYTLIPNSDLPGNTIGFTDTIVDITQLDPTMYPSVFVGITLRTTNTSVTPALDEIGVYYRKSETGLGVAFDIRGDKTIGTDSGSSPIYKYTNSLITNGSGEITISDLEFDAYTLSGFGGRDIASACPDHPFVQPAGVDSELELVLVGNAASTLRVSVTDSLGRVIPGASVNLTRSGYGVTVLTNSCGQAFFTGGVSDNNDYTIAVTATGYNSESISAFEIAGDTKTSITLTE